MCRWRATHDGAARPCLLPPSAIALRASAPLPFHAAAPVCCNTAPLKRAQCTRRGCVKLPRGAVYARRAELSASHFPTLPHVHLWYPVHLICLMTASTSFCNSRPVHPHVSFGTNADGREYRRKAVGSTRSTTCCSGTARIPTTQPCWERVSRQRLCAPCAACGVSTKPATSSAPLKRAIVSSLNPCLGGVRVLALPAHSSTLNHRRKVCFSRLGVLHLVPALLLRSSLTLLQVQPGANRGMAALQGASHARSAQGRVPTVAASGGAGGGRIRGRPRFRLLGS